MPRTFEVSPTSSQNSNSLPSSQLSGHTHQYTRKAYNMDLAPDHFAYTDPQPESSKAAAARAKLAEDRIDSGVASIASTTTQDDLLELSKQSLGTDDTGRDIQLRHAHFHQLTHSRCARYSRSTSRPSLGSRPRLQVKSSLSVSLPVASGLLAVAAHSPCCRAIERGARGSLSSGRWRGK